MQTVPIDYPVTPRARYGYGKPPHGKLHEIINRNRAAYESTLRSFLPFADRFSAIPTAADPAHPAEPHWVNGYFPPLDAISLYGLIATRRPALYMEIGSGNSTKFAARAVRDYGIATKIVSIDPDPRAEVNDLCERIVRRPLEDVDVTEFDRLAPGDVLLFDGSHRCFPNSDVTVFFLEVLPRLRPGVLVAIHDVFLPNDYPPPVFIELYYSEQYLLAAYLLAEGPKIDIVLPVAFVQADTPLLSVVAPLYRDPPLSALDRNGALFWFRTR